MKEISKSGHKVILVSAITYCSFLFTAICFTFLGIVLNHDARFIWVIGFWVIIFFSTGYFSYALKDAHRPLKLQVIVAMIITAALLMLVWW